MREEQAKADAIIAYAGRVKDLATAQRSRHGEDRAAALVFRDCDVQQCATLTGPVRPDRTDTTAVNIMRLTAVGRVVHRENSPCYWGSALEISLVFGGAVCSVNPPMHSLHYSACLAVGSSCGVVVMAAGVVNGLWLCFLRG